MFKAKRKIGPGNKYLMIAEVGQTHGRSLGMAHSYIDAISNTGCRR